MQKKKQTHREVIWEGHTEGTKPVLSPQMGVSGLGGEYPVRICEHVARVGIKPEEGCGSPSLSKLRVYLHDPKGPQQMK